MRMVPLRRELDIEIFTIVKILSKLFEMLKNTFSSLFRNPVNHNSSEKFDFFNGFCEKLSKKEENQQLSLLRKFYRIKKIWKFMNKNVGIATGVGIAIIAGVIIFQVSQTMWEQVSVEEYYEKGEFPKHLISKFAELGFFGVNIPTEYGCSGMSNIAYGLILHELERGDSGLRSFASVQGALVMYPIHAFGSSEQKVKWLSDLGKGIKIGCFGLTESNFGSNPGGMATTCKRDGNEWIINGSKMWITGAGYADWFFVLAYTD